MPRRQYTFSDELIEMIEKRAKWLIRNDPECVGKRIGTISRTLMVACVRTSFADIKSLSWTKLRKLAK